MKRSKTRLPALADQFDLAEAFLASPDAAALKSALIRATDRSTGDPVMLKYWEKTGGSIDADLRALWRHEMRQVERVRAFPGADEVIVDILTYGETSDAFFVATSGELAPLEFIARRVKTDHWLRSLHVPRRRLILWENIRRLAIALGAMHDQGVVHGRLDQRAIFTTGGKQADFRIGGFEWCLRVAEAPLAPVGAIAASRTDPLVFSFLEDWRGLGVLAISLLEISYSDLEHDRVSGSDSKKTLVELKPSETDLLRSLLSPERNQALNSEIVSSRIDGIVRELNLQSSTDNGRYVLALRLGDTSKLSSAIRVITSDTIETDDRAAQIDFVIADIQTGAQLSRGPRGHHLLTETLAYELQPLRQAGSEETWSIASCNMAKPRADLQLGRIIATEMPANRVEVITFGAASQRLQELRGDALDWSVALADSAPEDGRMLSIQRGLLLAQVAEALFRASEIVPVEVAQDVREHGKHIIRLTADDQRSKLNAALGIEDAPSQLRRFFEREEADLDAEWQLSESGGLGSGGRGTATVRFLRLRQRDNGLIYEFQSDGPAPPAKKLFLRKVDDSGTWRTLQNRLRMLAALGTQQELSAALTEPRSRLRNYPERPLEHDAEFLKLDASKRSALDSILSTGPVQLVVGPPGVGKTTLVVELVRRILMAESGARLLISAQAHQALDHLASAVQKAVAKSDLGDNALLVRSRSNKAAKLEGAQTQDRAKHYLAAIDSSPLVQSAPLAVRRAINDMRQSAHKDNQRNTPADRERRSFEALILQSANVLFSTTNSGDLARLVDERTQFDWVIVEEAAKATGSELLAPQLLSMRRVLIGDHNQLPPFDTDRIMKFLGDQTRVRTALAECDAAVGAVFRDHGLDELRDALTDDATLSATCETARRTLLLFEALVNQELDRQARSNPRRRVATELLEQHRMHPVIGELVSECFYSNRLVTPQPCRDRFASTSPPFSFANSAIPVSPIVFVNMPYVQNEPGAAEEAPNYHNPAEVKAIISVLSSLRAGSSREKPSLAVLSGYKQQVDRLGRAMEDELDGTLQGLSGFAKPSNMQSFAGTVDSFQGNEADITVLSLVRNNDHVGGHALGFLRDRRRMNVFLSRAKWQMIIVGSLDFLRVQSRRYNRSRGGDPAASAFLSTLVGALDRLHATEMSNGVRAATFIDWRSLAGIS